MTVSSYPLPEVFLINMKSLLKGDFSAFLETYNEPALRGAHFSNRRNIAMLPEWASVRIPWAENAWYLDGESQPGRHPLHWAGQYYLQEPSAMAAVSALDAQPGERVLDLCAAPGGKTSLILNNMKGKGLLLTNELYLNRAKELSRNLERMGVINGIVTANLPEELSSRLPEYFDKVLVDAPCSGEGMFRKEPEVISHWHKGLPSQNAERQLTILNNAGMMLKDGGTLVYSTCTFNETENERVIEAFLESNPGFVPEDFHLNGLPASVNGMLRLWPHRIRGEGHFVARLRKSQGPSKESSNADSPIPESDRNKKDFLNQINEALPEWVVEQVKADYILGGVAVKLPDGCPNLQGLKVLRLGLHLGSLVGKTCLPEHALALALTPRQMMPLDLEKAERFRLGEQLSVSEEIKGFVAPCLEGWPLGWGKATQGMLKNHYPKGLRKPG